MFKQYNVKVPTLFKSLIDPNLILTIIDYSALDSLRFCVVYVLYFLAVFWRNDTFTTLLELRSTSPLFSVLADLRPDEGEYLSRARATHSPEDRYCSRPSSRCGASGLTFVPHSSRSWVNLLLIRHPFKHVHSWPSSAPAFSVIIIVSVCVLGIQATILGGSRQQDNETVISID